MGCRVAGPHSWLRVAGRMFPLHHDNLIIRPWGRQKMGGLSSGVRRLSIRILARLFAQYLRTPASPRLPPPSSSVGNNMLQVVCQRPLQCFYGRRTSGQLVFSTCYLEPIELGGFAIRIYSCHGLSARIARTIRMARRGSAATSFVKSGARTRETATPIPQAPARCSSRRRLSFPSTCGPRLPSFCRRRCRVR